MADIAKKVVVDRERGLFIINGEPFGYHIGEEVNVSVSARHSNQPSGVTVTIFADEVEIVPIDHLKKATREAREAEEQTL